jgi:hydroxyacylglutathione hydrolase
VTLHLFSATLIRVRIVPLRLKVGYAYLVQDKRAVLVDTGMPGDGPRLRALLEKEGVAPQDLSLIMHTHAHWDHCGSTRELKEWTNAPTAVHAGDAETMVRGDNGELKAAGWAGSALKPFMDKHYPGVVPDLILEDNMDLGPFGIAARVITTPGHTPGSVSLLTAQGDAIVGDLFMGGYWGGTLLPRRPTYHYFADDLPALRASIDKLLNLSPVHFFPGHGGPLDPATVARSFNLLDRS